MFQFANFTLYNVYDTNTHVKKKKLEFIYSWAVLHESIAIDDGQFFIPQNETIRLNDHKAQTI